MILNKRIKNLTVALLMSLIIFGATSQRANAWIIDPFESFVESSPETNCISQLGLSAILVAATSQIQ